MSTKRIAQLRVGKGLVLGAVVVACVLTISRAQANTSGRPECEGIRKAILGRRLVVDTDVLNAVNGNLQTALNCVPEGGVLELNLSTLPFNGALDIKKSVTIEGGGAAVECPDASKPVFRIRSNEVRISRLNFEGCKRKSPVGLIHVKDSKNVVLEELRFVDNRAVGSQYSHKHRCISAVRSEIEFSNIFGRNNIGGVIFGDKTKVTIRGSEFFSNEARISGGAMLLFDSDLEIFDTTFERNKAKWGGAILAKSTGRDLQNLRMIHRIKNATFAGNFASKYGGALQVAYSASLTIQDSLFYQNQLDGKYVRGEFPGGGVLFVKRTRQVEITRTDFTENENRQGDGGAIFANGATLRKDEWTLSHCTFHKNSASAFGGAVRTGSIDKFTIRDSRFIENFSDGGGAFFNKFSKVEIFDTLFEGNTATNNGGAIASAGDQLQMDVEYTVKEALSLESVFTLIDAEFKGNKARNGGAVSMEGRDGRAVSTTQRCHFQGNVAQFNGGGIASNAGRVTLSSTTFRANQAAVGGAVYRELTERDAVSHTNILDSIFEGNLALQGGGAVYCEYKAFRLLVTTLTIKSSSFSQNLAGVTPEDKEQIKVDGAGGALMILDGTELNAKISNSTFSKNAAGSGGAIYVRNVYNLSLKACNFSEGSAHKGGALLAINPGKNNYATDVNFLNNSARWGGAISLSSMKVYNEMDGVLQVKRANFKKNTAVEGGGAIDMSDEGLRCEECLFDSNKAGNDETGVGGAISAKLASNVALLNSSIFNCTATQSGGGMFFQDATFAAENVMIKGNVAGKAGGGFAIEFGGAASDWGCTSCDFDGNKAAKGGGLHVAVKDALEGASESHVFQLVADSEEALLENTKDKPPQMNQLFIPQVVLNQSSFSENTGLALGFGSDIFLEDRRIHVCCDGKCWTIAGTVDEALESCTFTDGADKELLIGSSVQSILVTPPMIMDHASDKELPVMNVAMLDSFGRITKANATLQVQVTTAGAELFGSSVADEGVFMSGQLNVTGLVMRAVPGKYTLRFGLIFDERDSIFSAPFLVDIRPCVAGEITSEDRQRCDRCPEEFFSFNVSDKTCSPCPVKEAKCSGATLAPLDGFWHSGPRSQKLHSCLIEEACTYTDRIVILFEAASNNGSTWGLQPVQKDYPQCAEGYEDVLCGSCKASHGKRGLECGKCRGKLLTGVGIVLVMLGLAGVSLIYVRSAAKHAEEAMADNAAQHALSSDSLEPELKEEARLTVPQKRSRPTDSFKILVNFFQITGSAAAINVDWTASMTGIFSSWDLASGGADTGSFFAFECLFSTHQSGVPRSMKSSILLAVLPFVVWAAFVTIYACYAFKRRKSLRDLLLWSGIAFRAVLQASYISLTRTFLRLLYCVDVEPLKGSFWVQDTSISCYKGHHLLLVLFVGAPGLLFVSIGFPCWLVYRLLWRRNSLAKEKINVRYGFLYKAYKDNTPAWEVVILVRKALFSAIVVFGRPLGGGVQTCLALFVMVVSIVLQMHFEPFLESKLNTMELGSLMVSTLAFIIGNLVSQPEVTGGGKWGLTIMFFCVVGVYIVFMTKRIFEMGSLELRTWVERKTLESQLAISNLGLLKKVVEIFYSKFFED